MTDGSRANRRTRWSAAVARVLALAPAVAIAAALTGGCATGKPVRVEGVKPPAGATAAAPSAANLATASFEVTGLYCAT